ncbi:MAG: hypothetical protein JO047_12760 [Alphaproteobacteria bacterium]|nr:hypothetical protein [Alphaproteobacteria bacterium]
MSMRSFFLWFWGIVFGGGVAASAALALLQNPSEPKPSAPAVQPVVMREPLPVPPVPAAAPTPAHQQVARAHPHESFARLLHVFAGPRHAPELAASARISVVPPIPPAAAPMREAYARPTHLPPLRIPARAEPRPAAIPAGAPIAEARAFANIYARNYPRYRYYTYTYSYPYAYYPYPYSYSYQY